MNCMNNMWIGIAIILLLCLFIHFGDKKKIFKGGFNFTKMDLREYYLLKNIDYKNNNKILELTNKNKKIELVNFQINSVNSSYMMDDKVASKFLLQKYKCPTSKYFKIQNRFINDETRISNLMKHFKLKYPVVIKPVRGSHGNGVKTDINNFTDLFKNLQKDFLVEEQLEGENYRILVIDDKVISSVICREKPFIIGDGKTEFIDLINKKNETSPYKLVVDYDLLNESNITDSSIIEKNKKIIVNNVVNYHKGATLRYVPASDFHEDNIKMFSKINKIFGSRLCGIDFISKDISKSYKDGYGSIIELNSGAHELIHYNNDKVDKNDFFDEVFDVLFK